MLVKVPFPYVRKSPPLLEGSRGCDEPRRGANVARREKPVTIGAFFFI